MCPFLSSRLLKIVPELLTRGFSKKKIFLKISQVSQETQEAQLFYCEICENFRNTYLEEYL